MSTNNTDDSAALHAAYRDAARIEDRLLDAIQAADPTFDYYDVWTDDYDNSVEFHVCGDAIPSKAIVDALTAFGFSRVWFNYDDGTESFCGGEKVAKPYPRVQHNPKAVSIKSTYREFDALKARAERAEALLREARDGLSTALDDVDWETTDHDIAITERLDATIKGIDAALTPPQVTR